ncbi:hypothetical protein ABU162_25055 [Paenibacillus thiaminolyticus]|uniref:hypothetical protein n=1 Tax=Paenibacillus thiaminolyticus TaxID=49283 RepID=UPI0035A6C3A2
MQKAMELKPATINRRLITLKRYFEWAVSESKIRRDLSKPVKLVQDEKVSPRQMTDKEKAALVAAAEHGGSLRDQTLIIVMLHTGLRTMEGCDLARGATLSRGTFLFLFDGIILSSTQSLKQS